jgi:hypothetical protein
MDSRDWVQERRARTRRLIELGGLVSKSRLPERIAALEPDQAAAILGALTELAASLEDAGTVERRLRVTHWREQGRAALRAEPTTATRRRA